MIIIIVEDKEEKSSKTFKFKTTISGSISTYSVKTRKYLTTSKTSVFVYNINNIGDIRIISTDVYEKCRK